MSYAQTSIDAEPTHGADIGEKVWACQVPERPDLGAVFDWRCRGCTIAALAHVLHGSDTLGAVLHQNGTTKGSRQLGPLVAEVLADHASNGLQPQSHPPRIINRLALD